MSTRKIQFGAGTLHIPGFENLDDAASCDISKPLDRARFPDECADIVFSEMCLEHISHREAWNFLCEAHRILKPGGFIRIVIPDFSLTWRLKDPDWLRVNQGVTGNDGSLRDQMKSIIFAHGHQGLWNSELLRDVLEAIGFTEVSIQNSMESKWTELCNLEQHGHSVGFKIAASESGCVEGRKP